VRNRCSHALANEFAILKVTYGQAVHASGFDGELAGIAKRFENVSGASVNPRLFGLPGRSFHYAFEIRIGLGLLTSNIRISSARSL